MRSINISRGFSHLWYQLRNRDCESPHTISALLFVLLEEDNIINLNKYKFISVRGKEKI